MPRQYDIHTLAVHGGHGGEPTTGAVAPPLHMASTFAFATAEAAAEAFVVAGAGERQSDADGAFVYTRWGNPTQAELERQLAALEGGEAALATASGMAAISAALLNTLRAGDHIVCTRGAYSATYTLLAEELPQLGVTATFVDATDPANVAAAMRPTTRVVYLESPGNPTLALNDLAACAEIAHAHGALAYVDNTFATPYNQRPLALGCDVVVHSLTKYLCGHGDAIGGAIIGGADFIRACRTKVIRNFGGIISPFNAWLIRRGAETLPVRMARHNDNALAVARALESNPDVAWVRYPGLPSHPQHALARRQMRGFGGMVCFEVRGGLAAGARLMRRLRLCIQAVSLGDTRTLICHAPSTTHSTVPAAARRAAGIIDGLVRLSVGLEDPDDIVADLTEALAA